MNTGHCHRSSLREKFDGTFDFSNNTHESMFKIANKCHEIELASAAAILILAFGRFLKGRFSLTNEEDRGVLGLIMAPTRPRSLLAGRY